MLKLCLERETHSAAQQGQDTLCLLFNSSVYLSACKEKQGTNLSVNTQGFSALNPQWLAGLCLMPSLGD